MRSNKSVSGKLNCFVCVCVCVSVRAQANLFRQHWLYHRLSEDAEILQVLE